jgi:hypothetical protein
MKMKSFAVLAMSGLLTAAFAYSVPALADDTSTGQSMQSTSPASTDNSQGQSGNASTDNSMNGTTTNSGDNTSSTGTGTTTGTGDEGNPDTATGDDDY